MDPSSSPLSMAILGLVSCGVRTGYDLRRVFATTAMGHFSSSPGAVYPALERLERAGLLAGAEDPASPRGRRLFRLSEAGTRAWAEALGAPVTREEVLRHMDGLMLRFSFMGNVLGPGASRAFLEGLLREVEAHLRSLEAQREAFPDLGAPNALLALEQGLATYGATGDWARRALLRFPSEGSPPCDPSSS